MEQLKELSKRIENENKIKAHLNLNHPEVKDILRQMEELSNIYKEHLGKRSPGEKCKYETPINLDSP